MSESTGKNEKGESFTQYFYILSGIVLSMAIVSAVNSVIFHDVFNRELLASTSIGICKITWDNCDDTKVRFSRYPFSIDDCMKKNQDTRGINAASAMLFYPDGCSPKENGEPEKGWLEKLDKGEELSKSCYVSEPDRRTLSKSIFQKVSSVRIYLGVTLILFLIAQVWYIIKGLPSYVHTIYGSHFALWRFLCATGLIIVVVSISGFNERLITHGSIQWPLVMFFSAWTLSDIVYFFLNKASFKGCQYYTKIAWIIIDIIGLSFALLYLESQPLELTLEKNKAALFVSELIEQKMRETYLFGGMTIICLLLYSIDFLFDRD